jgi:hypothetical protein
MLMLYVFAFDLSRVNALNYIVDPDVAVIKLGRVAELTLPVTEYPQSGTYVTILGI